MIRSQQDQLAYMAGSNQAKDRALHDHQDQFTRKDKLIERLIKDKRSLEFRLRDQTFRNRRRR